MKGRREDKKIGTEVGDEHAVKIETDLLTIFGERSSKNTLTFAACSTKYKVFRNN